MISLTKIAIVLVFIGCLLALYGLQVFFTKFNYCNCKNPIYMKYSSKRAKCKKCKGSILL